MGGKKGVGEEQVAEGAGLDGVIETEDGETVDGEGEGTAGDDGVEHDFEGIKVRGVVARSRRLDRELKHDERAVDEVPLPNSAFIDTTGLDGC